MHNNYQSAQLKIVPQSRNCGNYLRTRSLHFYGTCKIGLQRGSVVVAVFVHVYHARSYSRQACQLEVEKDCPCAIVLI